MQTQTVQMTPKWATKLLSNNPTNRLPQPKHVAFLAQMMWEGKFLINGDTIRVAKDGRLLDGQHRLAAVVLSGITVTMILVTGLDPASQATMDRAKIRKSGDWLTILGYKDGARLAASARLLWIYERGLIHMPGGAGSCEPLVTEEVVKRHPGLVTSMAYIDSLGRMSRVVFSSNAIPPFAHYLFSTGDKARADLFLQQVIGGNSLPVGAPAFTLRNKLLASRLVKPSPPAESIIQHVFRAWNAHTERRPLFRLALRKVIPAVEGNCLQPTKPGRNK